ncbi:MAG: FtsX-like permease family protein [Acidimicrobiia bacterium]|nr:FtsX-like permease family protein [Acidimicrobiia bacterium]
MSRFIREFRRAPARILASVFALSLALGAIGVMGVPHVASSSLRDEASTDVIANIAIDTTDTAGVPIDSLVESIDDIDLAETQISAMVEIGTSASAGPWADRASVMQVLGVDVGSQQIDILRADAGRLPTADGEILVVEGLADLGMVIPVTDMAGETSTLTVVGIGGTSYWSGEQLAFSSFETARELAGTRGSNRLVVRADGDADELRALADTIGDTLADADVAVVSLPVTVPAGQHPIEAEIAQVSVLVGLLGIVAGIVALVLLASTTTTLITKRSREVAVMRALGGRQRAIRRRLRRLALAIAAAAVVIGVPLGVLVSNYIARMVLEEFVGLTPGFAFSVPVMVGSALFALVGARLVAARAARRVVGQPLATALRDRDANPFGRRVSERLAVRIRLGGLLERTGLRNGLHQRSRSLTMLAQITAAVAALLVVTSMATTVTAFNDAEYAHWDYETHTSVPGPGLDMPGDLADGHAGSEMAIETVGEYGDWMLDVVGAESGSTFLDAGLDEGRWYAADDAAEAVLSTGFAQRVGLGIGDSIDVRLPNGTVAYQVVGLHPARGRYAFLEVDSLSADLGSAGMANVLLSAHDPSAVLSTADGATAGIYTMQHLDEVTADENGRDAIVLIFTAIGLVIVSVAGLAVASGLAVNVYERRHELAALQAIGGRRRHVTRVVFAELAPIAVVGVALGVVFGYFGALGIVGAFESADAVEIGLTFAAGAIPVAGILVVVGSVGLGALMARRVTRRPAAVTLRSAA